MSANDAATAQRVAGAEGATALDEPASSIRHTPCTSPNGAVQVDSMQVLRTVCRASAATTSTRDPFSFF
jgi:hypothetical protein